jgi:hypothetical protein
MLLVVMLLVFAAACATRQDDPVPVSHPPLTRWDGLALIHAPRNPEPAARPIFIVTLPFATCPRSAPAEASRDWVCRSITLDPGAASANVHIVSRTVVDAFPELGGLTQYMIIEVVPGAEACAQRRAQPADATGPGQASREDMQCRPAALTIR